MPCIMVSDLFPLYRQWFVPLWALVGPHCSLRHLGTQAQNKQEELQLLTDGCNTATRPPLSGSASLSFTLGIWWHCATRSLPLHLLLRPGSPPWSPPPDLVPTSQLRKVTLKKTPPSGSSFPTGMQSKECKDGYTTQNTNST